MEDLKNPLSQITESISQHLFFILIKFCRGYSPSSTLNMENIALKELGQKVGVWALGRAGGERMQP